MKLWNYIFLLTGISVIAALAGLDVAGFTALFTSIGLNITSAGIGAFSVESTLWSFIFGRAGILTSIGVSGAIGIGTFIYTKDKSFLMIPIITGVFFYWISVLISVVNYVSPYPIYGTILAIIFIPLTVGFIQSCVDWFMGMD